MKRLLRALSVVAVVTAAAASALPAIAADDWVNMATVSMTNATTPKLTNRYICYTDGQDLACNAPSVFLSTGGQVGVNTANANAQLDVYGTISATNFVGDGSGLTGVTAGATDRIVSGTNQHTRMVAISDTGYISVTQSGVNTDWFDPARGFVTIGVSSTGPISGSSGNDKCKAIMRTLDRLNAVHGRDTITSLFPATYRSLRSEKRSPRYTTEWDELLEVA